jgi:hypothetical protein
VAREFDQHHLIPRSRGGGNGPNKKKVRRVLHMAWHHLFFNLLPWEVIQKIALGEYPMEELSDAKRSSWLKLFGAKSREEILRYIRKEWYPPYFVVRYSEYQAILRSPFWGDVSKL